MVKTIKAKGFNVKTTTPSAPSNVSVSSFTTSAATVTFTGSTKATSYTVTSTPGSITATCTSSPLLSLDYRQVHHIHLLLLLAIQRVLLVLLRQHHLL